MRAVKPEPEIYRIALESLGVRPDQSVFVGDGGSDELRGAREMGIHHRDDDGNCRGDMAGEDRVTGGPRRLHQFESQRTDASITGASSQPRTALRVDLAMKPGHERRGLHQRNESKV